MFKLDINLKHALVNGLYCAIGLSLLIQAQYWQVVLAFIMGALGGSVNDLVAFRRNNGNINMD